MIKFQSDLTHIELYATDLDESVRYYEEEVGLRQQGLFAVLGNYYVYSVVLFRGDEPGMVSMTWRTSSPEALDEAARRIDATEYVGAWKDASEGIGVPTFSRARTATRCSSPIRIETTRPVSQLLYVMSLFFQ